MHVTRNQRRQVVRDNVKLSDEFKTIPRETWPLLPPGFRIPIQVWRNNQYLVQVYEEKGAAEIRLSIIRSVMIEDGEWQDGLSWEVMQKIKSDIGYGDAFAVEIYPPNEDVVNVANMRHLWLMKNPPDMGWKRRG